MATFNALLELQVKTGEEIQRVVTNFKKDSVGRKSNAAYYKERLRQLNLFWDEYENRDSELRCKIDQPMNHEYFTNQYDKIREIAEYHIELFNKEIVRFEAQEASGLNAGANKPGPNHGVSTKSDEQQHDTINTCPTTTSQHQGLIRKITARMTALRRLLNSLSNVQEEETSQFYKVNISTINQLWNQLQGLQDEALEKLEDQASMGFDQTEFIELGDLVRQQLVKLSIKEDQFHSSNTPFSTSGRDHPAQTTLPLPKVTIPNFNGDYLKWQEFYNLFYQMIDKQPLPLVQKMWYLKSNVSGEAAKLISHLSLTDENYNAAWTLLQDRYNNKRIQVGALVQKLLEQPLGTSTAVSVKNLHDTTRECLLALNNLGVDTTSWDPLILHILIKKLDRTMHIRFEQSLARPRELLQINEFLSFLELQFQSMESIGSKEKSLYTQATTRSLTTVASTQRNISTCRLCNTSHHPLYFCKKFLQLSTPERLDWVQKNKLCVNCFKQNHTAKNCPSRTCTKCDKKHNSLVHLEGKSNASTVTKATSLTTARSQQANSYVLLSTAIIKLSSVTGQDIECRALLDSGSQVNLITERLVKRLRVQQKSTGIHILGIGNSRRKAQHRVNVGMQSKVNGFKARVEAFVMPHIISSQPNQHLDTSGWAIPNNITLADPHFNRPDKIDILLGAEFYHQLLVGGQITLGEGLPILQNTRLGWIIAGKINNIPSGSSTCGICSEDELDQLVEKFWKLEEVEATEPQHSIADKLCGTHFVQNTTRNVHGRFIVKLPLMENATPLGKSREIAYNRFLALERRLTNSIDIKKQYVNFMEEYEAAGHMSRVDINKLMSPQYFIPHHYVLKPDSSTTKLRVVFDASAKTSSGLSLNDIMYNGPTVQNELFSILLRFRLPRFVFTADIQQMYRQILIHPDNRPLQLIIWRSSSTESIKYYQLNTVTYGTRAAPYLATRCLQQLANEFCDSQSLGAQALREDFYVDDCLTGSDSLSTALETQRQLTRILTGAGFKLRKWCANHPRLLQGIAQEDVEIDLDLNDEDKTIKALGISWTPKNDKFCIKVNMDNRTRISKRNVSSELARLFDPLGIMAPVVVTAKMFLQELWQLKLSWDEALPVELHTKWISFKEGLKELNNLKFSRHMFSQSVPKTMQFHAFADASERAYGAAIYIRSVLNDGTIIVRLLCAKSRVAPLKKQTLPRLELCAAVLGAQLLSRVKSDLHLEDVPSYLWTDSEIVLSWINSEVSSFQTFVANRVATIQELTLSQQWRHVRSKDNPADVLSRGLSPKTLVSCNLWFYGPLFLHGDVSVWPKPFEKGLAISNNVERKRKLPVSLLTARTDVETMIYSINHGNSFRRLQRTLAYVLRFIKSSRGDREQVEYLTPKELDEALVIIIRTMQAAEFQEELRDLKKNKGIKSTSQLSRLSPFLDSNSIMRVGGRLENSSLSYDAKHQMIIPYNDPITKLLMQRAHDENMHCGTTAMLSYVKQRFWPIKGKTMARSIVHTCIRCSKAKPQLLTQMMGNLPSARVTPSRPFINSGVDYCGPVWIHFKTRGKKPQKAYIAVFCCFATKAVHLEIVSDLTTDAFIGALKRFFGRRGHCQNLYSDNATNFVGAKNKLNELALSIYAPSAQEKMNECTKRNLQFHFIPPRAPHFGGLWEAAVKSAKHLLVRTVSTASLTYEELETVIVEIEAILNSRPLTPISDDPNDFTALTPGHFLIGEPLTAHVDVNAASCKSSLLTRWKLVSYLKQEFWRRWSREYLNELQCRLKWKEQSRNIEAGTIVIIKEDNVPPLQWPMGRIVKTYQGDDGLVRVADVKTAKGVWKRPIHRLAPLPVEDDSQPPQEGKNTDHSDEEYCPSTLKKRKVVSLSTNIVTLFVSLLFLPLLCATPLSNHPLIENLEFTSKIGLHFEGMGSTRFARTEWNILVYYDLQPYRTELEMFLERSLSLHKMCQDVHRACSDIVKTIEHIGTELLVNDKVLHAHRTKRGAVNIIGNIANSLFGVLDSEYADRMTDTINRVNDNEQHLSDLLKNQTSIIDSTLNIMKHDQVAVKQKFEAIDDQLRLLTNQVHAEDHRNKLFELFTLSSIQLTMVASNIRTSQTSFIKILTDTRHGTINPTILSPRQIQDEILKIRNHLPKAVELPINHDDDLLTMYKLMRIKGGLSNDHIIFLISLPLVDQLQFDTNRIIPVPSILDNIMVTIKTCNEVIAISSHRDQYVPVSISELDACTTFKEDVRLCYNSQATYNKGSDICSCEVHLLNNEPQSNCILEPIATNATWVQLNHENKWIYALRHPSKISAVCGNDVLQLSLEGVGMLKFQPNCILKQKDLTIQGLQSVSSTVQSSYTRVGNFTDFTNLKDFKPRIHKLETGHYDTQIQNLTAIQQSLSNQLLSMPFKIHGMNYHQTAIGYVALFLSVVIIAYYLWKSKTRKRNLSATPTLAPIPVPRSTTRSDFSINVA